MTIKEILDKLEETISIQVVDEKGDLKSAVTTPRTKAIERMAKAIWKSDNKDLPISYWEKQMKEAKERYLRRAEAALEALIKGE